MKSRHKVLGLLCLLAAITYLDRVAISVAGPRIQESLNISPEAWGWVVGIFTVSYALFEIPTGRMGDRTGARRVLTRVVLWWSAFTAFTGMTSNYYVLLLTRFCFGAGEAGAFPNIGICVSRWFPIIERARATGTVSHVHANWRSHRSLGYCARPDALWLARLVLYDGYRRRRLEPRVVLVVSGYSSGESECDTG
jgi:predicted MFS family arabinose efflux permease